MSETEQKLIDGLREAVRVLYNCRYSEQPLAKELDGLLKEITGKSQFDLAMDWAGANLAPCREIRSPDSAEKPDTGAVE